MQSALCQYLAISLSAESISEIQQMTFLDKDDVTLFMSATKDLFNPFFFG